VVNVTAASVRIVDVSKQAPSQCSQPEKDSADANPSISELPASPLPPEECHSHAIAS